MGIKERVFNATEFKAKCLKILDGLDRQGIIVTKRGRSVARVIPMSPPNHARFYGCIKGKIVIKGNIFSTGRKWNAQS